MALADLLTIGPLPLSPSPSHSLPLSDSSLDVFNSATSESQHMMCPLSLTGLPLFLSYGKGTSTHKTEASLTSLSS